MSRKPPRPTPIEFASLPFGVWLGDIRIRFADCDPAGIVYFPRFFERVHGLIEDWMAARLGLAHAEMTGCERIGLGYAHASADFFSPGRDGDTLTGAVLVSRIGRSSIEIDVPVYRSRTSILVANLVMVTTSLDTRRPIDVPMALRVAADRYVSELGP